MNNDFYRKADATTIARLVCNEELRPEEVLSAAFDAIAASNSELNAVIRLYPQLAEAQLEAGLPRGPLCGVPVLLKDLGSPCKGTHTTFGSALFADLARWEHDCALVSRLKRAGAVVIGRTNCCEFGISLSTEPQAFGRTHNPHAPDRSAGGSSGGAGAAVASGMTSLALGTDGCGSLRVPASHCGVFALKPSRGRISFAPDQAESWAGMTTHGVLSRTVRDTALFLDVVSGPEPGDPYFVPAPALSFRQQLETPPRKLRIGLVDCGPEGLHVHRECRSAVHGAGQLCLSLGHRVEPRPFSYRLEEVSQNLATIWATQLWLLIAPQYEKMGRCVDGGGMEADSWQLAQAAPALRAVDHLASIRYLHQSSRELARLMHGVDVLLTPVAAAPAEPFGARKTARGAIERIIDLLTAFPFTISANIAGLPAMSVPLWQGEQRLPVGVQFIAPYGEEALLLGLAAQLENVGPWQPAPGVGAPVL